MSELNVSLVGSNHSEEAQDKPVSELKLTRSCCCFRVFKRCRGKNRENCETYELQKGDKVLLVREDEIVDSSSSIKQDDELTGTQTGIISESPLNRGDENIDSGDICITESLQGSIGKTSADLCNVNITISSVDCYESEAANKTEKPQDNSLNSDDNNYNNNNVDIPNINSKHDDEVINNTTCENKLEGKITHLGLSLDAGDINKQSSQSSSGESTVDNTNSQLTVDVDSCEVPEKKAKQHSEGLVFSACSELEANVGVSRVLALTSGPEEYFESSDKSASDREGIEIQDSLQSAHSLSNFKASDEDSCFQNTSVDVNFEENLTSSLDNNQRIRNTLQTDGQKPFPEEVDRCCDTENVNSNILSGDVPEYKTAIENKSPNFTDVNPEKPGVVVNSTSSTQSEPDTQIGPEEEIDEPFNGGLTENTHLRLSPEGSEGVPCLEEDAPFLDDTKEEVGEEKQDDMNYYSLVSDPLLYTQGDLDEVIKAREDDWQQRQDELERKIKEEVAMRELLEEDHRSKMDSLKKSNGDMKMVVSQYEKTIMDLTEHTRNTPIVDEDMLSETVRAKDQLHQDLNQAEANLVDAYKRIEKLKLAVDTYKNNEENLKVSVKDYQSKLQKSEERYNKLKQHASEKIDSANTEIERVRKQKEIDLAGIQASLKKAQNRVANLDVEIAQKTNENKELSQICDELIKKVSGD